MINCKICGSGCNKAFSAKMLNKYDVAYYKCATCGFLFTEAPYWLNEAYGSSISILDTGIMVRNIKNAVSTAVILSFFFGKKKKFLDYAGGYGLFTRLMRDLGFDFYWSDMYSDNLVAKGFEHKDKEKIECVTAFECFEHFTDPIKDLEKIFSISKNIIFSTELLPEYIPGPKEWWYYVLNSGQHISFYSSETLKYISKKYDLNYISNGNLHIFSEKKLNTMLFKIAFKLKYFLFPVIKLLNKSLTAKDAEKLERTLNEKKNTL